MLDAREQADLAECAAALQHGSRTFFAASMLLPRAARSDAIALYAFCRAADDAVDCGAERFAALAQLRERLACIYAGRPWHIAADRALRHVVARVGIPRALLEALLEGFEWDAQGRRYDDLPQLLGYAARVAGTVGAMMALLMGVREPVLIARACDLGVAMQLTNIARDVGEDARAGRLYLPQQWLRAHGIDPDAWLHRPAFQPELGPVVARLLHSADELYVRAAAGIARLPAAHRASINLARWLYAEIGREVERRQLDSVSQRAVVPRLRKFAVLLRALATTPLLRDSEPWPALEQTRFLVEAVATSPKAESNPVPESGMRPRTAHQRVLALVDLIERLERRDRSASAPPDAVSLEAP